jgi:hypothetical protein
MAAFDSTVLERTAPNINNSILAANVRLRFSTLRATHASFDPFDHELVPSSIAPYLKPEMPAWVILSVIFHATEHQGKASSRGARTTIMYLVSAQRSQRNPSGIQGRPIGWGRRAEAVLALGSEELVASGLRFVYAFRILYSLGYRV